MCCNKQYKGASTSFQGRFLNPKSDINTRTIRCGVVSHLLNVCKFETGKTEIIANTTY